MATISYFLLFMLMIQGITIFSNNVPMVEASRGLVYSENLTPPPGPSPSNSSKKLERKLQGKSGLLPPPTPTANVPNKDSATDRDNINLLHGLKISIYPTGAVEPTKVDLNSRRRHLSAPPGHYQPSPPRHLPPPPQPVVYRPEPPQVYRPEPPGAYRPSPPQVHLPPAP